MMGSALGSNSLSAGAKAAQPSSGPSSSAPKNAPVALKKARQDLQSFRALLEDYRAAFSRLLERCKGAPQSRQEDLWSKIMELERLTKLRARSAEISNEEKKRLERHIQEVTAEIEAKQGMYKADMLLWEHLSITQKNWLMTPIIDIDGLRLPPVLGAPVVSQPLSPNHLRRGFVLPPRDGGHQQSVTSQEIRAESTNIWDAHQAFGNPVQDPSRKRVRSDA